MFENLRKLFRPKKKEVKFIVTSVPQSKTKSVMESKYTASNNATVDSYYDPLSPLNPISLASQFTIQEPAHKSNCGSSHHTTPSFDHSHSSSYDSGSCSSSYDSGSSSSSSDF